MKQLAGEQITDYVTRLRVEARFGKFLCASCEASYEEEAIIGSITKNTNSPKLRQLVFERNSPSWTR
ncbi:Putative LOC101241692 [Caligus rogercresseyi]|uniref:LOC101241692 n=1 Tax=Caligus rogercresseyi TaxID=217165 RepID=A0A7T8QT28_CALRO|nr:Putative LOC101241692 [Caligus rogercresseyi]